MAKRSFVLDTRLEEFPAEIQRVVKRILRREKSRKEKPGKEKECRRGAFFPVTISL